MRKKACVIYYKYDLYIFWLRTVPATLMIICGKTAGLSSLCLGFSLLGLLSLIPFSLRLPLGPYLFIYFPGSCWDSGLGWVGSVGVLVGVEVRVESVGVWVWECGCGSAGWECGSGSLSRFALY
ncbi:hypothetical protein C1646_667427 [Rhizophagus diaphanus]|nr:hypothetical protein C1646_667427 [Rhizophagus diaphanus] [Rhizophagus sp. MUCL 43196]